MAVCPRGHESAADDYCDECGTPMRSGPAAGPGPAAAPVAAGPVAACPVCGSPLAGRFCENCGNDSLAPGTPVAVDAPVAVAPVAVAPVDGAVGWQVVVSTDEAYFERMRALHGPDAHLVEFPRFCPERRFPLVGQQLLIGRRSRSRGIYPDIDLTGPPEDSAVSHQHALLVPADGGRWAVVDLHSTNCTYLNGSADAIAPEVPVPLNDGDHVNVGAWTRLTVRPVGR